MRRHGNNPYEASQLSGLATATEQLAEQIPIVRKQLAAALHSIAGDMAELPSGNYLHMLVKAADEKAAATGEKAAAAAAAAEAAKAGAAKAGVAKAGAAKAGAASVAAGAAKAAQRGKGWFKAAAAEEAEAAAEEAEAAEDAESQLILTTAHFYVKDFKAKIDGFLDTAEQLMVIASLQRLLLLVCAGGVCWWCVLVVCAGGVVLLCGVVAGRVHKRQKQTERESEGQKHTPPTHARIGRQSGFTEVVCLLQASRFCLELADTATCAGVGGTRRTTPGVRTAW